jgi:two-component system, response regulator PdtaR
MSTTLKNKPVSVLIVEDEVIIALEIESRLRNRGFNLVGTVASSEDAIDAAMTYRPDVIIMDIHIQGSKDGIDVSLDIFNTYKPAIIFISAYTDNETRAKASKVQPSYFLAKPISYDDLTKIIRESVSGKQSA